MSKPSPKIQPQTAELRCFRSLAAEVSALPDRIRVVPWGETQTVNGPIIVDDVTAAMLPANQAAAGFGEVMGDYEHGTAVPGKQEPQAIAARGRLEVVKPGGAEQPGLYYVDIHWTESGREHVGGGHYPGVSIACLQDKAGRVIFGHSVGFVRNPAVPGMTVFSAALALPSTKPNDKTSMKLREASIAYLRSKGHTIADDITDEALAELLTKTETSEPGELATFSATVLRELKGLKEQMGEVKRESADAARSGVIARLQADGVDIPLSDEALKRFSAEEILKESAKWTGGVPRDGTAFNQPSGLRTYGAKDTAADKAKVAAQLGLDPSDL